MSTKPTPNSVDSGLKNGQTDAKAPITSQNSASATSTIEAVEKATDLLQAVASGDREPVITGPQTTVKMLKNHPQVGAFKDATTTLPARLATELIAEKYAVAVGTDGEEIKPQYAKPSEAQKAAAEAAYERYGAVTDFKNFQGNPMPEFEKLPEAIQCAWAAAANLEYSHKVE